MEEVYPAVACYFVDKVIRTRALLTLLHEWCDS
jgi:hypothetical protein